jgi:hypothetical protein
MEKAALSVMGTASQAVLAVLKKMKETSLNIVFYLHEHFAAGA